MPRTDSSADRSRKNMPMDDTVRKATRKEIAEKEKEKALAEQIEVLRERIDEMDKKNKVRDIQEMNLILWLQQN